MLKLNGTTLVRKTILECLANDVGPVSIVVGSSATVIIFHVLDLECSICVNDNWSKGMGNSIALGVGAVSHLDIDGVILVVSDQPYFSSEIIGQIVSEVKQDKKQIITSKYDTGQGPPTYFSAHFLEDLMKLKGDVGAKAIIKNNIDSVTTISFPKGDLDIDTEADLEILNDQSLIRPSRSLKNPPDLPEK